jgi:5S rRNA maturation endonuclease (ribonuclease M5)
VHRAREADKAKLVQNLLQQLREGVVIVEGKHDKEALKAFGIDSFTFYEIASNPSKLSNFAGKKIYLLFDNDKGGEEKNRKMVELVKAYAMHSKINDSLAKKLLGLLNCTSIEQVPGPLRELLDLRRGDIDGENIFGYSQVHGSSELQH